MAQRLGYEGRVMKMRVITIIRIIYIYINIMIISIEGSTWAYQIVEREDGLCASSLVFPYKLYNCLEYVVETEDHFLLGLQRISLKQSDEQGVSGKKPVLLLHGIDLGGDVFVLNPPSQALGFILTDSGYDVWIGNTRTTSFSYGHAFYQRIDKGFWDWSLDELAEKDLPTMIGLVYEVTRKKMHFIGYSQGTQQAFAAFSEGRVEMEMIDKVVMLAPVAYVNHIYAPIVKFSDTFYIDKLFEALRIYEFRSQSHSGKQYVDYICKATSMRCYSTWVSLFTGNNCCLNYSSRPIINKYETQPTSVKNLAHLAQQYRKKTFAKFDYGFWGNLKRYRNIYPPAYELKKFPAHNMMVVYGGRDPLSDVFDVHNLLFELDNKPTSIKFIPEYAHLDFILGTNAKDRIYNQLIQFLESS